MVKRSLFYILLAVLSVSCAPYRMKSILAFRDSNYESALRYGLTHCQNHPNDDGAIELLNESAKKYVEQVKRQIDHFERIEDWQNLIRISNNAHTLLSQVVQVVGVKNPTKADLEYLLSVKDQSKLNNAQQVFEDAMNLYNTGDYSTALDKFNIVNSIVNHYRNTDDMIRAASEKLAANEYNEAKQMMLADDLENALNKFENTIHYVPNFRDANSLISSIKNQLANRYFSSAENFMANSDYESAYDAMEKVIRYQSDYPMALERLKAVEDKLTLRIAVFPFDTKDLNSSYGEMAAQQVISELLARNDKFIKVLERQNLDKLFEEQALSQTGAIDEATAVEVGKLGGVNTIILGAVSLLNYNDSHTTKETKIGYYDRVYLDERNVKREKKEKFEYSIFEKKRTIEINVGYRMINVETGEIIESHSVNSTQSDVVNWVDAPKARKDDLPDSVKKMSSTSKNLKPRDSLINGALSEASGKVSNFIISKMKKGGI